MVDPSIHCMNVKACGIVMAPLDFTICRSTFHLLFKAITQKSVQLLSEPKTLKGSKASLPKFERNYKSNKKQLFH